METRSVERDPAPKTSFGDRFRHALEGIVGDCQKEVIAQTRQFLVADSTDVPTDEIGSRSSVIGRPAGDDDNRLSLFHEQAAQGLSDSTCPRDPDDLVLHSLAHYKALSLRLVSAGPI